MKSKGDQIKNRFLLGLWQRLNTISYLGCKIIPHDIGSFQNSNQEAIVLDSD